ncbi:MAG TPA: PAS domain-containing protein [Opitutaceae bacterium]|nr:PAS domain-containing protein [Opitutaceae bacterium]
MNDSAASSPDRVEAALRDSPERLQLAVSSGNVGLWDWDLRTNEVYFSPEWKKQIGHEDHEIGNDLSESRSRMHPEDLERVVRTVDDYLAKPWPDFSVQFRLRHKDGSYRWILAQASVRRDAHGKPVRMLGSHIDVTEPRRAEEALRAVEARLRLAVESSNTGLWDWDLVTNETFFSPIWKRQLGCEDHEIPNRLEEWRSRIHPEDAPTVTSTIKSYLEKPWSDFEIEYRLRHKDGSYRWILSKAALFRDDKGKPVRMLGSHVDLTERKRAEQALREAEERFSAYMRTMPLIAFMKDADGRLLWVNEAFERAFDMKLAGWKGKTDAEIWPPETARQLRENDLKVFAGSGPVEMQETVERPGGVEYWISCKFLIRDGLGRQYLAGTAFNVTDRNRTEETKRAAEARYRSLFDCAPDGILIADPQSHYLDANASMCRMLGYAREELVGLHAADIVVPEEIPRIDAALGEIKAGSGYHREWQFRRKDGSTFPAEVIVTVMPDGNLLAMIRDITERKRAAAALRASEEQLAGIISSVDGIVWEASAETFQFSFVSPRAERLLGFPVARWISEKNFWANQIHPDDREEAVRYCVECTREMRDHEFEYRMIATDGSVVWLRDIVTVVVQNGHPVKLRGIMVDVTERKRVEAELRGREHRLSESQRLAHIGSWLYESSGQANWTEEMYRIFGVSRATFTPTAEKFLRLIHADDRAAVRDWMASGLDGKKLGDLEFRRVLPGGKIRHIYARGELLHDSGNRPVGMAGTAQDVTERKELEGHFLRTQRMEVIGTLASGIAHDLNNILAPILMGAGMVKSRITSPDDAKLLSIMEQSAQRGADVIRQLLTFSRGAEGQRAIVQPRHLLKEIVDIVRETFPREITVVDASASQLRPVLADATQMHQVLLNLCVNARDAMASGGHLTVAAQNVDVSEEQAQANPPAKAGEFVMLSVADTGHGIPREIVPRVFDPFFTTKELGKGTGLGLSSVLGIARSHGGFVTVESEPGQGSVFKVFLPAAPIVEEKAASLTGGLLPAGDGELILVVDDEMAVRETTKLILEQFNYRVVTAANGEEAMGTFLELRRSVQVVITDLMMPVMGGVALLRGLRALAPDLKVIATTGLERREKSDELKTMGASAILMKPYKPKELLSAVRNALIPPGK